MFKNAPELWNIYGLQNHFESGEQTEISVGGKQVWVPARPIGRQYTLKARLSLAWMVLTGKADVVVWPGGQ